jgi:flagellar protein FliO/FliZ
MLGLVLLYLVYALLLVVAVLAGLWSYRVFTTGETSFSFAWLFPPRPEPRLSVMEHAYVDRQRRLVLIRRDDVEHLIMTGGPVDVVIETGIAAPFREEEDAIEHVSASRARHEAARQEPEPPVFARKRAFGQAVNE